MHTSNCIFFELVNVNGSNTRTIDPATPIFRPIFCPPHANFPQLCPRPNPKERRFPINSVFPTTEASSTAAVILFGVNVGRLPSNRITEAVSDARETTRRVAVVAIRTQSRRACV